MKDKHAAQPSRRQLQTEQTKDCLFQAGVALLKEKDYDQITIREIVARAQVSIGTFYNYYNTKNDLFYETYRVADQYFEREVAPALTQPDCYGRILAFFDAYAIYCSEQTDMKMTRLLYNPDNPWFNRQTEYGMGPILTGLIQDGLDSGELVGAEPAGEIATYLMIAARGLVYHWCTRKGDYPLREATRRYVDKLLQAYLPPRTA